MYKVKQKVEDAWKHGEELKNWRCEVLNFFDNQIDNKKMKKSDSLFEIWVNFEVNWLTFIFLLFCDSWLSKYWYVWYEKCAFLEARSAEDENNEENEEFDRRLSYWL